MCHLKLLHYYYKVSYKPLYSQPITVVFVISVSGEIFYLNNLLKVSLTLLDKLLLHYYIEHVTQLESSRTV